MGWAAGGAGVPERIGQYTVERELGAGGMGTVYLARSRGGRSVAVKVARPELAADPHFRARFRAEVEAARKVGGFHTASVVDADPDAAAPWLATAYIAGPTLAGLLAEQGPMDEPRLRMLGAALAEALQAIHACGLIHRDLKPGNIIMADDGPRVLDFGIARAVENTRLTSTGAAFGTPGYLAPEQAQGGEVGSAADVFALGVVLIAAAGGSAFGEGTPMGLMYRSVHEPPDLSALPRGIRPAVAECLAKDPAQRPTLERLLDHFAPDTAADNALPQAPYPPTVPAPAVPAALPEPTTADTPAALPEPTTADSPANAPAAAPIGPATDPATDPATGPAADPAVHAATDPAVHAATGPAVHAPTGPAVHAAVTAPSAGGALANAATVSAAPRPAGESTGPSQEPGDRGSATTPPPPPKNFTARYTASALAALLVVGGAAFATYKLNGSGSGNTPVPKATHKLIAPDTVAGGAFELKEYGSPEWTGATTDPSGETDFTATYTGTELSPRFREMKISGSYGHFKDPEQERDSMMRATTVTGQETVHSSQKERPPGADVEFNCQTVESAAYGTKTVCGWGDASTVGYIEFGNSDTYYSPGYVASVAHKIRSDIRKPNT
ncbi:protein kinase domain-containing protein [Streptomyces sp. NPDC054863]